MSNGWRWLYWIQLILAGAVYCLLVFTVPETYAPKILTNRAKKLREETGDPSHVTEEEIDRQPLSETIRLIVARPFQLLFGELIVFLISLYMSVLYGLLYMFFVSLLSRERTCRFTDWNRLLSPLFTKKARAGTPE